MIYVLIVAIALTCVVLLLRLLRGQGAHIDNVGGLSARTEPVDLAAFRNLTSPDEDAYLRSQLAPREFRRIQRLRNVAAIEYVRRAARNAAVLIRLGEAARTDADPRIARAGQDLANAAIRLRLYAFVVECKLYLELIAPGTTSYAFRFTGAYEQLVGVVTDLGRLQQPAFAGRIAAAL